MRVFSGLIRAERRLLNRNRRVIYTVTRRKTVTGLTLLAAR